jgi:hypothetical protein
MRRLITGFLLAFAVILIMAQSYPRLNTIYLAVTGSSFFRLLNDKLAETKDIADFGADPTNTTDSTPAWNAACAALGSAGGTITIPAGTFKAASPWMCSGKPVSVKGAGELLTVIYSAHTGVAMMLLPSNVSQHTQVESLAFYPGAATLSAAALQITYPTFAGFPHSGSYPYETTLVRDVTALSGGTAGSTFQVGGIFYGLWQSRIQGFSHWNGASGAPPSSVPGVASSGIQIGASYDVMIDDPRSYSDNIGIEQIAYSEAIHIKHPDCVGDTYCFSNDDVPADYNNGFNGLAFYMEDGECDVYQKCAYLNRYAMGFISGMRMQLRTDAAGYGGISLVDTINMQAKNNAFQSPGTLAVGVSVTQVAGYGHGNVIDGLHCYSGSVVCAVFDTGTSGNVLTDSFEYNETTAVGSGAFVNAFFDESGQNSMRFIMGPGQSVTTNIPLCTTSGLSSGTTCKSASNVLSVAP